MITDVSDGWTSQLQSLLNLSCCSTCLRYAAFQETASRHSTQRSKPMLHDLLPDIRQKYYKLKLASLREEAGNAAIPFSAARISRMTEFSDSATEVLYSMSKSSPQATLAAVTMAPDKWAAAAELEITAQNPSITALSSSNDPILVDPDTIMSEINAAISRAQDPIFPKTSACLLHLRDLGLLEATVKGDPKASKCSTFGHAFVILLSPAGMTILQGHKNVGERNSMCQWLEDDHPEPLNWEAAAQWLQQLIRIVQQPSTAQPAAALTHESAAASSSSSSGLRTSGKPPYTKEVRDAYKRCFGVDLASIGQQYVNKAPLWPTFKPQLLMLPLGKVTAAGIVEGAQAFLREEVPFCFYCGNPEGAALQGGKGGVEEQKPPAPLGAAAGAAAEAGAGACTGDGSSPTSKLLSCAACRVATYCSRECQKADWKAGHKQLCQNVLQKSSGGGNFLNDLARGIVLKRIMPWHPDAQE